MLEGYLVYSFASINTGSAELLEIALQSNLEMKNSERLKTFKGANHRKRNGVIAAENDGQGLAI